MLIITRDALSPRHSGVKAARQGPSGFASYVEAEKLMQIAFVLPRR